MDPLTQRRIGRTELSVTQLGFGGVPLGGPDGALEEPRAQATLAAVHEAGINFFDTSPWYGNTQSEHRIGHYLRSRPHDSYSLSTKVGRVYFRPEDVDAFGDSPWMARWPGGLMFDLRFDYTRNGIRRSYEDSLMRLGINTVDDEVLARVGRMAGVCHRHEVPLAAAALQFSLGHPAVAAVIPGASSPEQVHQNLDNMRRPIPGDLWAELKHEGLIRDDAPTPT